MLTFVCLIVFQLPRDLLFDFAGCIVKDFKLEHRGPWEQSQAFIDGLNFGFQDSMINDPSMENQPLDNFTDSLHHYLETVESDQINKSAMTTPLSSMESVSSEGSAQKRKLVRKTPPTLSMSSQGGKRIKREPMAEDFCSSERAVKWRTVEGCGPFFFVYSPCGL